MIDYEHDDRSCPVCQHVPTHWRYCTAIGCDSGMIDKHDEDPINYAPFDTYRVCEVCAGTGNEWWCPSCGTDLKIHETKKTEVASTTIEELKAKKTKLKADIIALIEEFEEATGVDVTDIGFIVSCR